MIQSQGALLILFSLKSVIRAIVPKGQTHRIWQNVLFILETNSGTYRLGRNVKFMNNRPLQCHVIGPLGQLLSSDREG